MGYYDCCQGFVVLRSLSLHEKEFAGEAEVGKVAKFKKNEESTLGRPGSVPGKGRGLILLQARVSVDGVGPPLLPLRLFWNTPEWSTPGVWNPSQAAVLFPRLVSLFCDREILIFLLPLMSQEI